VPFNFRYTCAAYNSQTDLTDTLYFFVACGGSSSTEAVEVKDLVFTGTVADDD
jgi:hypothetical protein